MIEPVQTYLRSIPPNIVQRAENGTIKMTLVGYPLGHNGIRGNEFSEQAYSLLYQSDVPFCFSNAPEGVHGDNPSHQIRRCPALIIKDEQNGMSYIIEGIDKIKEFVEHWQKEEHGGPEVVACPE